MAEKDRRNDSTRGSSTEAARPSILIEYLRPCENLHGQDIVITASPSDRTFMGRPCREVTMGFPGQILAREFVTEGLTGATDQQIRKWMIAWAKTKWDELKRSHDRPKEAT